MALTLASNKDNKITMWSENETLVKDFKKTKKLSTIFEDKNIPKNINVTNSLEEALTEAEIVFLIPSINYLEEVCINIKDIINPKIPVCIGTKGIKNQKFAFEIAKKYLKNDISVISGPTYAQDLANLEPVGFTIASKRIRSRKKLKKVFSFSDIKIETTRDLIGISICGSVKNVYAIGSGIIKGLKYNESTQALYLTNAYHELEEILYYNESNLATIESLAGIGDLVATCTSEKSRNFTYGEMISSKANKKDITKYLKNNTIEGIITLEEIIPLLKKKHIKAPIIEAINNIINNDENPNILVNTITKKR
jgi:glycerol-3-phosphate dehydrogenase (NAD(P)+)